MYLSSSEPGFLPANTTSRVSTKLTTASASVSSAEILNVRMSLFGDFGGSGSALSVERRCSPNSGSGLIIS